MSAYIVNAAHIDALVDLALELDTPQMTLRWHWENGNKSRELRHVNDMTEIGRMLYAQNARSVADRYREAPEPVAEGYIYRPTGLGSRSLLTNRIYDAFSPSEAHSMIRGYAYQSCESDDWTETEAYAFCEALKAALLNKLAPVGDFWNVTDEKLGRKVSA